MDNLASTSSTKTASKTPSVETTKTAVPTPIRTVLSENTSIFFKQYGSQFGKLRLSMQNISNSILHFKFKKSSGTKLAVREIFFNFKIFIKFLDRTTSQRNNWKTFRNPHNSHLGHLCTWGCNSRWLALC